MDDENGGAGDAGGAGDVGIAGDMGGAGDAGQWDNTESVVQSVVKEKLVP